MKKLLLLVIGSLSFVTLFAQGDIENTTYFELMYSKPVLNFGEIKGQSQPESLSKYYKNKFGGTTLSGSVNAGTVFYLKPTAFVKGFKAGIVWDFLDLTGSSFSFVDTVNTVSNDYKSQDLFIRYSMGLGVICTFSPTNKVFFDLYAKAKPTVGVNYYSIYLNSGIADKYQYVAQADGLIDEVAMGYGMAMSYGLNMRFYGVLLGLDYSVGNIKYGYAENMVPSLIRDQMLRIKLGFYSSDSYR